MITPEERYDNILVALRLALAGHQAELWTALPGVIESYDPATQTATVQPTIKDCQMDQAGNYAHVQLPVLPDVPVIFPNGGGVALTFPVQPGDECEVWFQSRCLDGWWQTGEVSPQPDLRMHDLSDGICIVGPRSKTKALAGVSTNSAQLRTDAGTAYVEVTTAGLIKLVSTTKVAVVAPEIDLTGMVKCTPGASGTFTTADTPPKVVTVLNGIIVGIV